MNIIIELLFVFTLGLCIGSFAACMIDRRNMRMSWRDTLMKPSHCLACKRALKPWQNIPVVSFIMQKGACAYCGARISPRLLMIEIGCGAAAVVLWMLVRNFNQ